MLCEKEMWMWSLEIFLHLTCDVIQVLDNLPSLLPSSFLFHLLRMQMVDFFESMHGE